MRVIALVMIALSIVQEGGAESVQLVNAFPNLTFTSPVFLTHPGDGTNRVFVVQQNGIIRVFANDSAVTSSSVFLNITSKLSSTGGEQGLLGLAFHPNYASNGYFYVNYTAPSPRRTVISRFSVSGTNPDKADSLSELILLTVTQPFSNHNGGMVMFGQDGYLYIGMGDGGSGGDPQNYAQRTTELLGKMLRIDVDSTSGSLNYGIPPDNPFVNDTLGNRKEIWAWGLRNPWRFSQDPVTGQIWGGDVGQGSWEEIDLLERGKNYGWRIMEGASCYNPPSGCDTTGLIFPVKVYPNAGSECSVTGGYVYRGYRRSELVGRYIYADYCSGKIWKFRYTNGQVTEDSLVIDAPFAISSFGVDQAGELYICNYSNGNIQRFAGPGLVDVPLHQTLPRSFFLHHNYPNPFNPVTTIRYELPLTGHVSLKVFDIIGQEVATLVDEVQKAGARQVQFDARSLANGVYLYRLDAGGYTLTRKMTVMK